MEKNKLWVQLARYFAGELSQEESKKMESWIKADSDREKEVNRLYEIWKESESLPYELDVDRAWMKVSDGIDKMEKRREVKDSQISKVGAFVGHSAQTNENVNKPGVVWRRIALVAATVLIIAMAGFFSLYTYNPSEIAEAPTIENQVFITKNGEQATYILSDGSKVMLHAGSRLEIPGNFNDTDRTLYLEGEAYFEVTHNEDKAFVVQSQHTYTRVLGTRFLVQAWPDSDERVEVVVSEGRVAFGDNRENSEVNQEVLLTKNMKGMITEGQQAEVSEVDDLGWYIGWTEGRLEFENRPLHEVLPRLERWYNIEIKVEESQIRDMKITAEVDYSQSMSEVLQGIALTHELQVDKNGRTYTFRALK